jgi:Zn finger protein HypA/HybF involved in hydrogenase expression
MAVLVHQEMQVVQHSVVMEVMRAEDVVSVKAEWVNVGALDAVEMESVQQQAQVVINY